MLKYNIEVFVMENEKTYRAIEELIKKHDTIVIYHHIHADFDAYGSQLGLKHLIQDNYEGKTVYAFGSKDQYHTDFIESMDDFDVDVVRNSLVFLLDTPTANRVDGEGWNLGHKLVRIDHHPVVEAMASVDASDSSASSTCQLVLEMAITLGWKISPTAARYLYAGITDDTVRLTIDKVDSRLMFDLGILLKTPFSLHEVNRIMYDQNVNEFLQEGNLKNKVSFSGDFAYLLLRREDLEELSISFEKAKEAVSLLGKIKGIQKYATIIQKEDMHYSASLRSHGPVINDIAATYGGGGHPLASGIGDLTEEQVKELIYEMTERR